MLDREAGGKAGVGQRGWGQGWCWTERLGARLVLDREAGGKAGVR